jgi:hypothetical protein
VGWVLIGLASQSPRPYGKSSGGGLVDGEERREDLAGRTPATRSFSFSFHLPFQLSLVVARSRHEEAAVASSAAAQLRPIVERMNPAGMAILDPDVGPIFELIRHYTLEYGVVSNADHLHTFLFLRIGADIVVLSVVVAVAAGNPKRQSARSA